MTTLPLLSTLIWLPILAACAVLVLGNDERPQLIRGITMAAILTSLLLCIPLYTHFDFTTSAMQFTETLPWLPSFGISYRLGVDGISMPFILLSTLTTLVAVLATWDSVTFKKSQYFAAFLVMQGIMVGVFSALDAVLFYVFFEAILVPMYLIIGVWGSSNRIYAAIKFFLFTFVGSVMMLVALLFLGISAGTFDILAFYPLKLSLVAQTLLFVAFFLGFAIKVPMWPVHTLSLIHI